ncbi:MAG TPA: helix-hairpin-helix domain-containing protein [Gallionellaceae bacterium]|nr:helix-hairpin-helix domain-containing protein [Gallionellaceae bacterium]
MKHHYIFVALTAVALLVNASLCCAVESRTIALQHAISETKASPKKENSNLAAKRKAHANIKLVNINGATREELKTLPGIGNAEADKIIAGRPYASKAHLVTQNVVQRGVYENFKKRIIAKQPYRDGAKNAALYNKRS